MALLRIRNVHGPQEKCPHTHTHELVRIAYELLFQCILDEKSIETLPQQVFFPFQFHRYAKCEISGIWSCGNKMWNENQAHQQREYRNEKKKRTEIRDGVRSIWNCFSLSPAVAECANGTYGHGAQSARIKSTASNMYIILNFFSLTHSAANSQFRRRFAHTAGIHMLCGVTHSNVQLIARDDDDSDEELHTFSFYILLLLLL